MLLYCSGINFPRPLKSRKKVFHIISLPSHQMKNIPQTGLLFPEAICPVYLASLAGLQLIAYYLEEASDQVSHPSIIDLFLLHFYARYQ